MNCKKCEYARKICNKDERSRLVGCSNPKFMEDVNNSYTGNNVYQGYMHPRKPHQEVSKDIRFSTSARLGILVESDALCNYYVEAKVI